MQVGLDNSDDIDVNAFREFWNSVTQEEDVGSSNWPRGWQASGVSPESILAEDLTDFNKLKELVNRHTVTENEPLMQTNMEELRKRVSSMERDRLLNFYKLMDPNNTPFPSPLGMVQTWYNDFLKDPQLFENFLNGNASLEEIFRTEPQPSGPRRQPSKPCCFARAWLCLWQKLGNRLAAIALFLALLEFERNGGRRDLLKIIQLDERFEANAEAQFWSFIFKENRDQVIWPLRTLHKGRGFNVGWPCENFSSSSDPSTDSETYSSSSNPSTGPEPYSGPMNNGNEQGRWCVLI